MSGDPDRESAQRALDAERASTEAQIVAFSRDLGVIIEAASSVATDDEHDPEGPTIAYERAQVAALLDRARERRGEIDAAEERLRDGSYGVCERCGRPIAAERLAARPLARTCIACAQA
jgi:RNA polymerase-binding transcription factor DksA